MQIRNEMFMKLYQVILYMLSIYTIKQKGK